MSFKLLEKVHQSLQRKLLLWQACQRYTKLNFHHIQRFTCSKLTQYELDSISLKHTHIMSSSFWRHCMLLCSRSKFKELSSPSRCHSNRAIPFEIFAAHFSASQATALYHSIIAFEGSLNMITDHSHRQLSFLKRARLVYREDRGTV
jgi:hypothetical protein